MNQPVKEDYGYDKNYFKQTKAQQGPDYTGMSHTVGEDTKTYALAPEASKARNFEGFSKRLFVNGLIFSWEGFGGNDGGAAGADSTGGLAETVGGAVGAMTGMGGFVTPTFRLRCISKSPTYKNVTDNQSKKQMNWMKQQFSYHGSKMCLCRWSMDKQHHHLLE